MYWSVKEEGGVFKEDLLHPVRRMIGLYIIRVTVEVPGKQGKTRDTFTVVKKFLGKCQV